MSLLLQQINQRLGEIISRLNQWEQNAKKTSEFEALLTANPDALIRVQVGNDSKKIPIGTILSAIPSALPDGVTVSGTIDREESTNNFTFTGFTVRINSVLYSNASPITRTIAVAEEGFKRIDIAIMDTLGNISIIQGIPNEDVAIEPTTPPSTVKLRQFLIVEDVVDLGSGVGFPFDMLTLDELLELHPNAYVWVNVDGLDLRFNLNELGVGSQDLQGVRDVNPNVIVTNGGEIGAWNSLQYSEDSLRIEDNFTIYQTSGDIRHSILRIAIATDNLLHSTRTDTLEDTQKIGTIGASQGKAMFFENTFDGATETTGSHKIELDPVTTEEVVFKTPSDTPSGTYKLATREWTENLLEGLKTKQPVRVATTANITLSGTQTIDVIALSVGDRVLVKDQTTQTENGIYLVKSGSWVRSDDANTATELTNAVVSVLEGTANGQATFRQVTTSITLGSSNIVWQSFGSSVPDATPTTKGKMKLFSDLLNSFTDGSVTQAAIVTALKTKLDYWHVQVGALGSTNSTSETVLYVVDVPAGLYEIEDFFIFEVNNEKDNINGNVTYRVRAGVNGDTSDALIATNIVGQNNSRSVNWDRSNCRFDTATSLRTVPTASSFTTDRGLVLGNPSASVSLNPASAWKLTITAQNVSSSDTSSLVGIKIGIIKKNP